MEIVSIRANSVHVKRDGKNLFPITIKVDDEEYVYGTWADRFGNVAVYYKRRWMFS